MDKTSEMYFNIQALNYAGFLVHDKDKKTSVLAKIRYFVTFFPYIIIHILCMIKFTVSPYTIIRAIVTIYIANNGFQTLFKHVYFIYKKQEIIEMLNMLEETPESLTEHFHLLDLGMRLQSRKHTRRFSTIMFLYNASTFFLVITAPMLYRMYQVWRCSGHTDLEQCKNVHTVYIYEFWWPTDIHSTPTYYYLVLWQILMVAVYIGTQCTVDAFTCSLMLAAAERCSLLARSASQCLLSFEDGKLSDNFRAWAKYHQNYLRLVDKINDVMGPLLLMVLSFAVVNIIAYLYFIFKFQDSTIVSMAAATLFGFVIQIFIYATAGQRIINKSKDMTRSTLLASSNVRDDGYLETGPARSCLQILSARCSGSRPEMFHCMGFFTVGMDLFAKVVSASVTYLLVILQMCHCTDRIGYEFTNAS